MQNKVGADKLKPQRSSCFTFSVDQSQCSDLTCEIYMSPKITRLFIIWKFLPMVVVYRNISTNCNAPVNVNPDTPSPPIPGKYGALAIKQNQTVIMLHMQGPLILSNPLPNMNKFPHPRAKLRLICHMQIKLPTESVCARLAQLVRSLTAKQKVPGSIPRLVEG